MIRHYYKTILAILLLNLGLIRVESQQVSISFNTPVYGQTLDGLSYVQLVNTYPQDLFSRVLIKVREAHGGMAVTIAIPGFQLRQGSNTIDRAAFSRGRISFGNNYYGKTLQQSGRFPEGEYEYCFEVDLTESKLPNITPYFENCFLEELRPMTPLLLINPIDGDEDCNKRPDFIWQPPMPLPPNAKFRIVVAELKEKQDIVEAINYNMPVINQGNLLVNQLHFPFNAPELIEGKKYVWQVIVYVDQVLIKRSEVWTYTVKCAEPKKEIPGDSYREMKENIDGNFYVDRVVRFSFNNPYSDGPMDYKISSLANPSLVIKDLPKLRMSQGLNKHSLDLSENKAFKNGEEYQIVVKLINGRDLRLRFIYTNEER